MANELQLSVKYFIIFILFFFFVCIDWEFLIRRKHWAGPPGVMDVNRYYSVISGVALVVVVDHVPVVRFSW